MIAMAIRGREKSLSRFSLVHVSSFVILCDVPYVSQYACRARQFKINAYVYKYDTTI